MASRAAPAQPHMSPWPRGPPVSWAERSRPRTLAVSAPVAGRLGFGTRQRATREDPARRAQARSCRCLHVDRSQRPTPFPQRLNRLSGYGHAHSRIDAICAVRQERAHESGRGVSLPYLGETPAGKVPTVSAAALTSRRQVKFRPNLSDVETAEDETFPVPVIEHHPSIRRCDMTHV